MTQQYKLYDILNPIRNTRCAKKQENLVYNQEKNRLTHTDPVTTKMVELATRDSQELLQIL